MQAIYFNFFFLATHGRAYFINCPFNATDKRRIPKSVSLTSKKCNVATNNLRVIDNQPVNGIKKKFAVCIKQIRYDNRDFMIKFIEWVHLMRIIGVEAIFMSVTHVHPGIY